MKCFPMIVCFLVLALSCKKKNNNEPVGPPETIITPENPYTVSDYVPFKYGNYWVYELTITDPNNVVVATTIDSSYVQDSSLVRGKWFYTVSGNIAVQGTYRDSSDYIIYTDGTKMFSLKDNDTTATYFYSQSTYWYNLYLVMKTAPTSFSYNSKTYINCVNRFHYMYGNMNPNCPNRIYKTTYCPGVGIVNAQFGYMNTCDVWEIKLLRCKVN